MGLFKNLIISYGFTTLDVVDGELVITNQFCYASQKTNQPFKSVVPDELTLAIIPESATMEIRTTEDRELYLWRPETPTLVGIAYEDSDNTPLPTHVEKDDPRLVDSDNDGKPGVTVFVDMMGQMEELYIARREIFAYERYLQENGNLEGFVHDRSEQLIIGASNPLLTAVKQEFVQHDDLTRSPIILAPIDDSYDCEKLKAKRDDLFPPEPDIWQ